MKISDLFSIENKVAVVTGGSRGIGEMITAGFLANGVKVYISARKAPALIDKAKELSDKYQQDCIPVPCDLSTMEGIEEFSSIIQDSEDGIDFLINNAGAAWGAPFDEYPVEGWDKVVDLNLKSPFFITQKLAKLLEKKGNSEDPSRIVNIASIDGIGVSNMADAYAYSASKSGIIHLTKHLAKTLVERNIIVNAIAPGPFDSHMLGKAVNFDYGFIAEMNPRKRIGTPQDMAGLCIYLCSRAGAFTVGETVTCDGGMVTTR